MILQLLENEVTDFTTQDCELLSVSSGFDFYKQMNCKEDLYFFFLRIFLAS